MKWKPTWRSIRISQELNRLIEAMRAGEDYLTAIQLVVHFWAKDAARPVCATNTNHGENRGAGRCSWVPRAHWYPLDFRVFAAGERGSVAAAAKGFVQYGGGPYPVAKGF